MVLSLHADIGWGPPICVIPLSDSAVAYEPGPPASVRCYCGTGLTLGATAAHGRTGHGLRRQGPNGTRSTVVLSRSSPERVLRTRAAPSPVKRAEATKPGAGTGVTVPLGMVTIDTR